jgi:hypothetical protein
VQVDSGVLVVVVLREALSDGMNGDWNKDSDGNSRDICENEKYLVCLYYLDGPNIQRLCVHFSTNGTKGLCFLWEGYQ